MRALRARPTPRGLCVAPRVRATCRVYSPHVALGSKAGIGTSRQKEHTAILAILPKGAVKSAGVPALHVLLVVFRVVREFVRRPRAERAWLQLEYLHLRT